MDPIQFTVFGTPKALKRHRNATLKDGSKIQYDPSADDKKSFLDQALNYKPEFPIESPLSIELRLFFLRPNSHFRTGKHAGQIKSSAPKHMVVKPDLDNIIKFILDSLNGIFYKDDNQVYRIFAIKLYTDKTPRSEIIIEPK